MLHQGFLKDWNPSQGRGFIQRDKAGPDICIHSSGFRKKPDLLQEGDRIFFQIEVDSEGKLNAVGAYKAGQHFVPVSELKKPTLSSMPFQRLLSGLVCLSALAWLGYQSVYLFSAEANSSIAELERNSEERSVAILLESPQRAKLQSQENVQFQCEGKQHCSEMRSCDEAKFYLKNCPEVMIDGDHDGVPCEQQFCGHSRY